MFKKYYYGIDVKGDSETFLFVGFFLRCIVLIFF